MEVGARREKTDWGLVAFILFRHDEYSSCPGLHSLLILLLFLAVLLPTAAAAGRLYIPLRSTIPRKSPKTCTENLAKIREKKVLEMLKLISN
jgi:hypothetical protein